MVIRVVLYILLVVLVLLVACVVPWVLTSQPPPLPEIEPLDLSPLDGHFPELTFRLLSRDDVPAFQAIATAPETLAENRWTAESVERQRELIADPLLWQLFASRTLIAVDKQTSEVVAVATLGELTPDELSIGLMVAAEARGRGFGRQTLAAMILTMQHWSTEALVVLTSPANERIRRIMERLGYTPDAELQPVSFDDGTTLDVLRYDCSAGTHPPQLA